MSALSLKVRNMPLVFKMLKGPLTPWIRVFLALVLVLSFAALPFHHHEEGHETDFCPVCHVVKSFEVCVLLLALLFLPALLRTFSEFSLSFWTELSLAVQRSRAPPAV